MAVRSAVGGGNLIEFYPLTTANVLGTLNAHTENKTKSITINGHPRKKNMVIDVDARHGDLPFQTFLTTHLYDGEVVPVIEKYEDGSQDTLTVVPNNGAYYLGYVCYFGAIGAARKILYGVGVLSGTTGNTTTGVDALEQTPLQLTAVAAPTSIAFASSVWNTTKANSTVAVTLPADSYGVYTTLTTA